MTSPATRPGAPARESSPTGLRLVAVPARHPYVDAVRPASATVVAPDRTVGWEPDPALDPAWVRRHAGEVDVVHVHFGFDHLTPGSAGEWVEAMRHAGLPLVVTVHDLRNPHHLEPGPHESVLGVLVAGAAEVLTLTRGAAQEVRARYGAGASVVPHPTLVDPRRTDDVATEQGLVTLHLKSLRANLVDPLALVGSAAAGAARGGGRLRVDVHPEVAADHRLAGLGALADREQVELVVHERFDDLALEAYLRRSHATVLPHRWGTHSGWLELARDLGTRVVAPSCGHYAGQWDRVLTYGHDERRGLDGGSLADAVARSLGDPPPAPADRGARLLEARQGRSRHAEVYAAATRHRWDRP